MKTASRFTFLALALAFSSSGCTDQAKEPSTTTTSATTSPSLYPIHIDLRDEHGDTIGADVFRGHPVIVSMFYGSCPMACPLLVTHVKQVEASLAPEVRADTRVLFVSFDEERDTPAALRALSKAHHVDGARWRFASGPDDGVRQLANALGVTYRKGPGGVFSHHSVITVLDAEGRIVARTDDLDDDLSPLAEAIRQSSSPALLDSTRLGRSSSGLRRTIRR